jgi:hypothetical protein
VLTATLSALMSRTLGVEKIVLEGEIPQKDDSYRHRTEEAGKDSTPRSQQAKVDALRRDSGGIYV